MTEFSSIYYLKRTLFHLAEAERYANHVPDAPGEVGALSYSLAHEIALLRVKTRECLEGEGGEVG